MLSALFMLLAPMPLRAQGGLHAGYAISLINPGDINRLIYVYNLRGGFDKEMPYFRELHGFTLGYINAIDDDIHWEFRFQNRHSVIAAERTFGQDTWRRELKLQQNFISAGFYFGNPVYFGLNMDVGNWRGFTRVNTLDSIAEMEWVRIFTLDDVYESTTTKGMQVGGTLYAGWQTDFVGFRFFYQYQFMRRALDDLDNVLLGADFEEGNYPVARTNNFGLELYFKIGGN